MARLIPDPISGLPWRPYKQEEEVDDECESLVRRASGISHEAPLPLPLTTDLLTITIEEHVEWLDLYADMNAQVEGYTAVAATARPSVFINKHLSTTPSRTNRLRSTLAHELYHLIFHAPYYQEQLKQGNLFHKRQTQLVCTYRTVLHAKKVDWREWQAAYGAGALLMPRTALQQVIRDYSEIHGLPPYVEASREAEAVITLVASCFEVSREAATVRLWQKGFVRAVTDGHQLVLLSG